MVRLGRAHSLDDAVHGEIDIEFLARRGGVVVCLQKGGQPPVKREGTARAQAHAEVPGRCSRNQM